MINNLFTNVCKNVYNKTKKTFSKKKKYLKIQKKAVDLYKWQDFLLAYGALNVIK